MKHYRIPAAFAVLAASAAVAWGATNFVQKADGSMCFRINSAFIETDSWCWSNVSDLLIDDGVTDSPSITMVDATDETAAIKKVDAGALTITSSAAGANDGLNILGGSLFIGNGAAGETINGEDLYVEGISEFDGQANFDGVADFDSTVSMTGALSSTADVSILTPGDLIVGAGTPTVGQNGEDAYVTGTFEVDGAIRLDGAVTYTSTQSTTGDVSILTPGDLIIGAGTPSVTQNGEDAYVTGTFEVDGASEFDGAVDFDSTITIGTVAINTAALQFPGRATVTVCGDATTVNANTIYYGPSQGVVTSATVGQINCNTQATGNATEATADEPALETTTFYPLGMVCWTVDTDVAAMTFTLRSAAAAITPAISASIADGILSGTAVATATTAVASGATLAVAVASASDVTKANVPFICNIEVAF